MNNQNIIEITKDDLYINGEFLDFFVKNKEHLVTNVPSLRVKSCSFFGYLFDVAVYLKDFTVTLSPKFTDCNGFVTKDGNYDVYSATEYLFPIILDEIRNRIGKEISFTKYGSSDIFGCYVFETKKYTVECFGLRDGWGFNVRITPKLRA